MRLDEERLKEIISEYFKDSRWDYEHTLCAVSWMKKLVAAEGGDERILVTAMYLHDIGYCCGDSDSLEKRLARKKEHMKIGAEEARKILGGLDYSEEEIEEICHLILVHDNLGELGSKNEILVMEADSLAGIDWDIVSPSFVKGELVDYLEKFKEKRALMFQTEAGKGFLKELLDSAEERVSGDGR